MTRPFIFGATLYVQQHEFVLQYPPVARCCQFVIIGAKYPGRFFLMNVIQEMCSMLDWLKGRLDEVN